MRQVLIWLGIVDDGEPLALPLVTTLAIQLVAGLVAFLIL